MIKKFYSEYDVVTVARQRIKNIFKTAPKVRMSISGGKDSIVLQDIVYKLCCSGEIDKSKLEIDFIDEEAIYPCVERVTKNIRLKWKSIGVTFNWWCIEVKHFNCFNMLTNDESFICWDRHKKDVWVRQMPPFAITEHPLLRKRKDTYQDFLARLSKGSVTIVGVRASESVQRLNMIASHNNVTNFNMYPIYDMHDKDIWFYIKQNGLEIPDAYLYMYQVGVPKNRLRISQFFSIDTAASLVNMCEYYPSLFDKICKREPNAYIAMLYYDTEMFRRAKNKTQVNQDEKINWKKKTLDVIKKDEFFTTATAKKTQKKYKQLITSYATVIQEQEWKTIYGAITAGDPKLRTYRSLYTTIFNKHSNGK